MCGHAVVISPNRERNHPEPKTHGLTRQAQFLSYCLRTTSTWRFTRHDARRGDVVPNSPVFDTTVTTVGAYRTGFEKAAADSWHGKLLPVGQ